MPKKTIKNGIIIFEILGFAAVILVVGLDEFFDLPSLLFGAVSRPFSWAEYLSEALVLGVLAAFTVAVTLRLLRRVKYLEGIIPACSFCKDIRIGDDWVSLEEYLAAHSDAQLSHGFCPACAEKHYGIKITE